MSIRALILSSSILLAAPLFARDKTDVMVMKNGDRMTCEIKGLDGGVLYVSFDYIDGTASVDWSKVARPGKQAVVHRQNAGRLNVHGDARHGGNGCRPAREDSGGRDS